MAPPKLAITCSINKKDVVGLSLEEEALMRQWIEYKKVIIDLQPITENILSELDSHLKTRSYMTGNKLSKADFEIHGGLHEFYSNQSLQFKEKHLHLSRWFSHVQHQNPKRLALLPFGKTLLY